MKKFLYYATLVGPICDLLITFIDAVSKVVKEKKGKFE